MSHNQERKTSGSQQLCVFTWRDGGHIFCTQNNETAAMFVSQTNPVGVELFSDVNDFFCSDKFA